MSSIVSPLDEPYPPLSLDTKHLLIKWQLLLLAGVKDSNPAATKWTRRQEGHNGFQNGFVVGNEDRSTYRADSGLCVPLDPGVVEKG